MAGVTASPSPDSLAVKPPPFGVPGASVSASSSIFQKAAILTYPTAQGAATKLTYTPGGSQWPLEVVILSRPISDTVYSSVPALRLTRGPTTGSAGAMTLHSVSITFHE